MLQGHEVKDGVSFTRVLPPQPSLKKEKSHNPSMPTGVSIVGAVVVIVIAILLMDQAH